MFHSAASQCLLTSATSSPTCSMGFYYNLLPNNEPVVDLIHILALLKSELILKKVLIFVNSIDTSFRLKIFVILMPKVNVFKKPL
ncbi:hypothetical protein SASPL_111942 [Salvia splendens]|uniref:Uncharacterized protein n=1 Tax=Salvia splendens TaxID=180675 RepID=A0A8X8YDE9_SALSN|nr:hypothetical protein SASPL_111942 [Salvia splendens]